MFRCAKCLEVSQPGETQYSLIVETREKTYTLYLVKKNARSKKYEVFYKPPEVDPTHIEDDDDDDNPRRRRSPRMRILTKHGHEIAKEIKVCQKCYETAKGTSDDPTSTSS